MLSPLTIVDVETTGLSPIRDRVIEIGILRVENNKVVKKYQSLINPQMYISPLIEDFTGIRKEDLERAPLFEDVCHELDELFTDSIFVAHNARFDYAFFKNEYKRLGKRFSAKQLCTVKLSQALYPNSAKHNLDAICDRFSIVCKKRHRAFDDAQVLWDFLRIVHKQFPAEALEKVYKVLLKKPSLPPHLLQNHIDTLPEAPGVYIFYAKDGAPLYVGKSINLKDRVLSHFTNDHNSSQDMQISQQIYSLETIQTAGELEALIQESHLVKTLQPLYNRKLRQSRKMVILRKKESKEGYYVVTLSEEGVIDPQTTESIIGIFKSRRQARDFLLSLAKEYGLCRKLLGLEKTKGTCFGYRLESCKGACVGEVKPLVYNTTCVEAFAKNHIKKWPFTGPIVVKEILEDSEKEGGYIIDKWCILGQWRKDTDMQELLSAKEYTFDVDTYKILLNFLKDPKHYEKISVVSLPKKVIGKTKQDSQRPHGKEQGFVETAEVQLGF